MKVFIAQPNAFQANLFQSGNISSVNSISQLEGLYFYLKYYFIYYDLYLGLWSSATSPAVTDTLTSFASREVTFTGYSRLKLSKLNWVVDTTDLSLYSNKSVYFNPLQQDWDNISGYFICSSSDNSGFLLQIVKYQLPVNLLSEKYLVINPIIGGK